jgi:hypothetical protein
MQIPDYLRRDALFGPLVAQRWFHHLSFCTSDYAVSGAVYDDKAMALAAPNSGTLNRVAYEGR